MGEIRPEKIIIAIDGHSACGKSTLAKEMSKMLGYTYVDSGAMYRAVTLFFIENQIPLTDKERIIAALDHILIEFKPVNGENRTYLNGKDVELLIREMSVAQQVSKVAAIPEVRKALVVLQQKMGEKKGVVMDGRDIGTVVFPDAELKIFLTAETEERVKRRVLELLSKNQHADYEMVRENLISRDSIDSTRKDSPLRKAADAITIDNTHLTRQEQLDIAMSLVKKKTA